MPATASTGANPSRAMIPVSEPRKLDLDKVEISPATMQAFRMMMREEISYGVGEVEARMMHKLDTAFDQLQSEKKKKRDRCT